MSSLRAAVHQLEEHVRRLEGNQARVQSDMNSQLRRADAALEDIVAALDSLRQRLDDVAAPSPPPQ